MVQLSPRVAIVIPVYNSASWIEPTISSILAQTYPHELLQIVIVDDGSSDASAAVSEAILKSSDIEYKIVQVPNGGPSRARNLGWTSSSGEWVQFLDSDDVIAPEKIEVQIRTAKVADPGVGVIYSEWQLLSLSRNSWLPEGDTRMSSLGADVTRDLIAPGNFLHIGSCVFRRNCLESVAGFDERHSLIEDVDLLLRIALAGGQFCHATADGPLFHYRQRGAGSLSRRDPAEFHEGCIRNAMMVESSWRAAGQLTDFRRQALATIYHHALRFFAVNNRERFEELVEHIKTLVPGFVPAAPAPLRSASRLVGFRRAELLSVLYRRMKGLKRPTGRETVAAPSVAR
jgi:glycosyltransferase involved in cell wall biosynthesis